MIPLGLLFILAFLVAMGTAVWGRRVDAGRDNLLAIAGIGLAFVGALTPGVRFGRAW
jgi:quinol-cytochrome oxidoreductase complex cytochrome b subunit